MKRLYDATMDASENTLRRLARSVSPIVSERTQLLAAASMWLVGAGILLIRGAGYLQGRSWHAWALAVGLSLGVLKARMILEGRRARQSPASAPAAPLTSSGSSRHAPGRSLPS